MDPSRCVCRSGLVMHHSLWACHYDLRVWYAECWFSGDWQAAQCVCDVHNQCWMLCGLFYIQRVCVVWFVCTHLWASGHAWVYVHSYGAHCTWMMCISVSMLVSFNQRLDVAYTSLMGNWWHSLLWRLASAYLIFKALRLSLSHTPVYILTGREQRKTTSVALIKQPVLSRGIVAL